MLLSLFFLRSGKCHIVFKYVLFSLYLLFLASFSIDRAFAHIGVKPLSFDFKNLRSGDNVDFEIKIDNNSTGFRDEKDINVNIYLSDFVQTLRGEASYILACTNPYSCASWITLDKTALEIKHHEGVSILKGTIRVPTNVQGLHYAAVMVEEVAKKIKGKIKISFRYAVAIRLYIKGFRTFVERAEIEKLSLEKIDGNPLIEAVVENTSEVFIAPQGTAQIKDKEGRVFGQLTLFAPAKEKSQEPKCRIYPGAKVAFRGRVEKPLPPGKYILSASFQYGKYGRLNAREEIVIKEGEYQFDEAASVTGGLQYQVEPGILLCQVPAGGFKTNLINITNNEQERLDFTLKLEDPADKEKMKALFSAFKYLELTKKSLTLEPSRSQKILLKATVPKDAQPGERYARIITEATSEGKTLPEGSLKEGKKEVYVVLDVLGRKKVEKKKEGRIDTFVFHPASSPKESMSFEVAFHNKGNTYLVPEGKIIIYNAERKPVQQIPLRAQDKLVLPGLAGVLKAELKEKPAAGEYVAEAQIDFGGERKALRRISFEVK